MKGFFEMVEKIRKCKRFIIVYRIFFAVLGWISIFSRIILFLVSRAGEASVIRNLFDVLSYFTIQSNILVLVWYTFAVFYSGRASKHPLLRPGIKGAVTLYITATFIIFSALLQGKWMPGGLDLFLSNINHYITPIAFIFDWLITEKRGVYKWKYIGLWLLYPASYVLYALLYGKLTGIYLYFFFNLPEIGIISFITNIVALGAGFSLCGAVFILLNKLLGKSGIFGNASCTSE